MLQHLTQLQVLDLSHTRVTDITPLAALGQLKKLCLSGTNVGEGWTIFSSISALEELDLSWSNLSKLANLSGSCLGHLKRLNLIGCGAIQDWPSLFGAENLEEINLSQTSFADLAYLQNCRHTLRWLHLDGCTALSDFSPLSEFTALTNLSVKHVDNIGLNHLLLFASVDKLGYLYLTRQQVPRNARQHLQTLKPGSKLQLFIQ